MRRSRVPSSPSSPYRALAHHHASGGGQQAPESVSSLIRSFNGETNPTRPMRPSPLTASTIADMPLELVDRIRSFPLFMSAPDEFLAAIGKHLRIQVHSAHDHILNEGDDARAMYWLVRGFVAVTSRDGEAVYAELKPGAFFGEIGVLMDVPRTATIIARSKCMLAVLKKEDLQAELPNFPDMEKAIRQEAQERLTILKKKQQERGSSFGKAVDSTSAKAREAAPGQVSTGEVGTISDGAVIKSKKRKSPSPGIIEDPAVGGSALTSGYFNVRKTLKELPLFSTLPTDILHFLGLSAQLKTYPPFTDIVQQGSSGQEIYFIVRGEAEVIHEEPEELSPTRTTSPSGIRPRLMQGQYFGEVASLGLSQGRTATVRSITTVECLMIGGDALDELWRRCPPDLRQQVEQTAKTRYQKSDDGDLEMEDVGHRESTADAQRPATPQRRLSLPQVVFTTPSKPASPANDESETRQPSDPDPFLSVDMENLRNRRRNSLAPPTPQSEPSSPPSSIHGSRVNSIDSSPLKFFTFPPPTPTEDEAGPYKKARILPSRPRTATSEIPQLTDEILVGIFQQLNFMELIRMRAVSRHWRQLLSESPKLCTHVDLSPFNRQISDWALVNIVAPFIGTRPVEIDISNCFHVSDEGFQALWKRCGQNVKVWRMKSVWEVSATQILDMSENAKGLEEIDWSNCRKVGDNLLARVVGWVVPEPAPAPAPSKNVVISSSAARKSAKAAKKPASMSPTTTAAAAAGPAPGSVVGCPNLKRLNLSYCKHITDRSMAHLAAHASPRLTSLSLTRCTSITDAGFQAWAPHHFSQLRSLCLADCTYLSDNAVVALVNAAKNLTRLDLSFCCALSDTATEVVALGLQRLRELRLAFCGSAVSDASLGCVALHLHELRGLSVRGCVRVTGVGVENVLEGCGRLEWLDVSQCKNLAGWLAGGGVSRWGVDERGVVVDAGAEEGGGVRSLRTPTAGAAGAAAAGGRTARGGVSGVGAVPPGQGPVMRPIIPPRGVSRRRVRPAVRFVVEKGDTGLR